MRRSRQPAILRLQGAIGNRATARLLRDTTRAATAAEEELERTELAHDLADRAKLAARPKYVERAPHALKSAGIDTNSKVDGDTPKWIQAALAESRLLRPYLRGKFPGSAITDGKFEIHSTERDFNRTYGTHVGDPSTVTDLELAKRYGQLGGYFDRTRKTIHVRYRSTFGQALHEAMHKVSSGGFLFWGTFIDEGVTQLLADRVLEEQGLPKDTSHNYGKELACAERLVAATNLDMVARAYFLNDPGLRETLMRRFGLTLDALSREIRAGTFCSRL